MATAHFQNQVSKGLAKGVPGDKASLNPHVYTDRNYLAGDSAITVGNFVWGDPANPDNGDYHGSGVFKALSSGAAGAMPLGIVERNHSYFNYDLMDGASLVVPEHAALNTVICGNLYAVASTVASRGQKVFATLADGSIQTGDAGATIAGAVETPWTVTEGGLVGDIITISNWSLNHG